MKPLLAYTNGTDTYIAYDIDDVRAQIMEDFDDYDIFGSPDDWRIMEGDKDLTLTCDDEDGRIFNKTLTVSEWIEQEGRGFLCTSEW